MGIFFFRAFLRNAWKISSSLFNIHLLQCNHGSENENEQFGTHMLDVYLLSQAILKGEFIF